MQSKGIVYCPMNSSPMQSSSNTANRTKASSGKLIWNSKLSSKIGLYPIKVWTRINVPVRMHHLLKFRPLHKQPLYSATPTVTRGLGFLGLFQRTTVQLPFTIVYHILGDEILLEANNCISATSSWLILESFYNCIPEFL